MNLTLGKSLLSLGPVGALLDPSLGHGVPKLPCLIRCFSADFINCLGIQIPQCGVLLDFP